MWLDPNPSVGFQAPRAASALTPGQEEGKGGGGVKGWRAGSKSTAPQSLWLAMAKVVATNGQGLQQLYGCSLRSMWCQGCREDVMSPCPSHLWAWQARKAQLCSSRALAPAQAGIPYLGKPFISNCLRAAPASSHPNPIPSPAHADVLVLPNAGTIKSLWTTQGLRTRASSQMGMMGGYVVGRAGGSPQGASSMLGGFS